MIKQTGIKNSSIIVSEGTVLDTFYYEDRSTILSFRRYELEKAYEVKFLKKEHADLSKRIGGLRSLFDRLIEVEGSMREIETAEYHVWYRFDNPAVQIELTYIENNGQCSFYFTCTTKDFTKHIGKTGFS